MALEPAGVSLEAQGFKQYVKQLDDINKKQKEAFDAEFKGTGKTFEEVTRLAKQYQRELDATAKAEQRAAREAENLAQTQAKEARKASQAQIKAADKARKAQERQVNEAKKLAAAQKTAAATQRQAFISTTQTVVAFVEQIATAAFELGKLGAQFEGQQIGLNNLASSFGQSGKAIQRAIVDASKGTVSDLQAIQAANLGLLLGVAQTPAEFEKLTSTALTLGRTLGLDATQSLEQFTTALGRQSLLILDNFGVSAAAVNNEIERLAQANFGKARSELTKAQQQAVFMEAALNKAGESAERIGDEAGNAQAAFDRLTASGENFKTTLGLAISDLNQAIGLTDALTKEINRATEGVKNLRGQRADATLDEQIESTEIQIKSLTKTLEDTRASLEGDRFSLFDLFGLGEATAFLDEAAIETQTEALAKLQQQLKTLQIKKSAEDARDFNVELAETPPVIEDATEATSAYASALSQAENLQLSFARAAEDSALKLARANEDIARKQAKAVADLEERQAKDRAKLLDDQAKRLDDFEKDRRKQIAKAEDGIRKARQDAAEQRKRDQKKLQRELQRAQEQFNLSQLQSERRFSLSERRLRAEGDILALQQLREDRELERLEEKENFDQSQNERKQTASEREREQAKDLENQLKELKTNLEDQRAELLQSFDEQLEQQQRAQIEQQAAQRQRFEEDAQERAIALSREEEDRRISQARQLEDLGRSFAEQEGITEEGTTAIANQLETVFGKEGVADNIMTGFTARTESEFRDLFEELEEIIKEPVPISSSPIASPGAGVGAGIPEFQEGGVIPGPIGSPQLIRAHGGETVLPTHQASFSRATLAAPVIPSQSLLVSGDVNVRGSGFGQANEQVVQEAMSEVTQTFRIAIQRLARRN